MEHDRKRQVEDSHPRKGPFHPHHLGRQDLPHNRNPGGSNAGASQT